MNMDAISRIAVYYPTGTLSTFWVLQNLIISNKQYCEDADKKVLAAVISILSIICFGSCFTDTYTATNGMNFWVIIVPYYGPLCFSLPTDTDKDRVYDYFYLKIRDYVHALLSVATFIVVGIFINPVSACLFPDHPDPYPQMLQDYLNSPHNISVNINGIWVNTTMVHPDDQVIEASSSSFDSAIVRAVPIIVTVISAVLLSCLGPPRQMVGYQNLTETCPPPERHMMMDNPAYSKSHRGDYTPQGSFRAGDYDDPRGPPRSENGGDPRASYRAPPSNYGSHRSYQQRGAPSRSSYRDGGSRGGDYGQGPRDNHDYRERDRERDRSRERDRDRYDDNGSRDSREYYPVEGP